MHCSGGWQQAIAVACAITLFDTFTVSSVLSNPEFAGIPRDLDVLELWTEAETVVQAARAKGLRAEGFDILQDPCRDLTTASGFKAALTLVLRLKPGGLLTMAPDCSSFVFGPTSTSGRKKGSFEGDTSREFVRRGNLQALIAGLFFNLAVARQLEVVLENPAGSMLFSYLGAALTSLTWLAIGYCDRCRYITSLQRATENFKKRYKFVASGNWILKAMQNCNCQRRHAPLMDLGPNGEVNGRRKDMKLSGLYPAALGVAIVEAYLSSPGYVLQHAVPSSSQSNAALKLSDQDLGQEIDRRIKQAKSNATQKALTPTPVKLLKRDPGLDWDSPWSAASNQKPREKTSVKLASVKHQDFPSPWAELSTSLHSPSIGGLEGNKKDCRASKKAKTSQGPAAAGLLLESPWV